MAVAEIMTREVCCCAASSPLSEAARLMWENDIGAVPVVDEQNRVVGVVTDRDIAMAALLQGRDLPAIPVTSAMSRRLHTCSPGDSLAAVRDLLTALKLHRLPVVDENGALVGIVSLNDLSLTALHTAKKRKKEITPAQIGETVAAIFASEPEQQAATG